jgi:hypothetical protein
VNRQTDKFQVGSPQRLDINFKKIMTYPAHHYPPTRGGSPVPIVPPYTTGLLIEGREEAKWRPAIY